MAPKMNSTLQDKNSMERHISAYSKGGFPNLFYPLISIAIKFGNEEPLPSGVR